MWQVLTDFENYPSWNPFIKKITGKQLKKRGQIQDKFAIRRILQRIGKTIEQTNYYNNGIINWLIVISKLVVL